MSSAPTIHGDQVWQAIEARHDQELRFRSAMITSTALHTGLTLAFLLAPLLVARPQLFQLTPVNLVQLEAPQPTPTPPPPAEEEAPEEQAPEPEPTEPEPPQPDDVPENLEAQRRAEEEEEARRREQERLERERREAEEERRRLAEEERRRREAEEEARRRAEEEARSQPQVASRQPAAEQTAEVTQQAERGEVGMLFDEPMSERDRSLLDYWINRVLANIGRNWQPQVRPAGSREVVAVVHFRVDRNGRLIVGPDVRSGSGDRRYDDAAARAVAAGQPFPPLPQAYGGSTLAINLAFRQE